MKRAIVTGGTHDDVAPMAVFAINIRNTNAHLFDEIVIFHDGIKEKDQKLIKNIFPTRFFKYEYPNKSSNDEVVSYFSPMVFCKYECFRLLEDYDEVIWSDYDVVIKKPLDEFVKRDNNSLHVLSSDDTTEAMFFKKINNREINSFDLSRPAICTPLLSFSNKLPDYLKICDWCYEKTKEWDEDLYLPEQCIFSIAVQKYNISLKFYPFEEYAVYPTKAKGTEYIIHAAGQPKFWNGLDDATWNKMYAEWLKLGGTRYCDSIKILKRKWIFLWTRLHGMRGKEHW